MPCRDRGGAASVASVTGVTGISWSAPRARKMSKQTSSPGDSGDKPRQEGEGLPRMGSGGASPMGEGILHRFRKNATEEVRATISTFKGVDYASIRVDYEAEPGVWHPTKKGLTIALDLLPELEKAVRALRKQEAVKDG